MAINHRKLFWIECDSDVEALESISQLKDYLPLNHAKGLLVGNHQVGFNSIAADRLATELGQSIDYLIFNAFDGFTPNALAQGAGLVRAPGLLVLITPRASIWPFYADPFLQGLGQFNRFDSNYIKLLINGLKANNYVVNNIESVVLKCTDATGFSDSIALTEDQGAVVKNLIDDWSEQRSTRVITADRGRGKSSALGYALKHSKWESGQVIVTAPDKRAVYSLFEQSGEFKPRFLHPAEALLELRNNPNIQLLVIDEAAAIATPLLDQLVESVNHLAVSTTVSGYEGFGRGFSLRFLQRLGQQREGANYSQLVEPVRWSQGDQLEATINQLLFLTESESLCAFSGLDDGVHCLKQDRLIDHPAQLEAIYQLLHLAHYRTSPNDLRVLLDSPGQSIFVTVQRGVLVAVAWISEEGELFSELSEAIAMGLRRPNGNLLPQTLIFSEGMVSLGAKRFWRIARIAVAPEYRRSGIAASMLRFIEAKARVSRVDFIGASFAGYQDVWQFWKASGFSAIRIGDRIDPVAGEAALLVLKALNESATAAIQFMNQQVSLRYLFEIERGLRSTLPIGFESLPQPIEPEVLSPHQIESLKRFAKGSAPLTLVRAWIERLEKESIDSKASYLEPNLNKQQLKALRNRVAQLIEKSDGIA